MARNETPACSPIAAKWMPAAPSMNNAIDHRTTQAMARRIFAVIGRADMIADARFSSNAARVQHRALVDEAVGGWFAARTREEALAAMREAGVTAGPVYTIADAVADAHFRVEKLPGDPTSTEIERLDDAERHTELERMVGGQEFIATLARPGGERRRR